MTDFSANKCDFFPLKRLASVDFIRGLAILAMIQIHIWGFYILKPHGFAVKFFEFLINPLGCYAAPLFVLVSGQSACLLANALQNSGCYNRAATDLQFLKRGLVLFALSTTINIIAGSILHFIEIPILNWSIFQLVGICLCFVPLFSRLRGWLVRFLWLATVLFLPELFSSHTNQTSLLFTGFAPLFPWGFLFFAGMLVGEVHLRGLKASSAMRQYLLLAVGGLVLTGPVGFCLSKVYRPFSWEHRENPGATSMLVFVGIFMLLVCFFGYLLDRRRYENRLVHAFVRFGQHSLTIYYLQLTGIVLSAMLIKSGLGYEVRLSWAWFLPLLITTLVVIHAVLIIWSRFNYRFTLEWFLARIVKGKSTRSQL